MGNSPSAPRLTEANLPDQAGKVFIVTGSTSGIGLSLTKLLYSKSGTVYIAARSISKINSCIAEIKKEHPYSKGRLEYIVVDFNDLTTVKGAVNEFLSKEQRLDVLWNNAGIMIPPQGTVTKQGYEAQLGVNTLAPFLFTKLLTPLMLHTAKSTQGSTRVVWVSSSAAERFAPQGGVDMTDLGYQKEDKGQWFKYGTSKAGNILHASEFAKTYADSGIISVSADPGNLDTDLYQNMSGVQKWIVRKIALKPVIYGAYTELLAGLSDEIGPKDNGKFVVPWGTLGAPRDDIAKSCLGPTEGGTGLASKFWEWSEKEVTAYI